MKTENRRFSQVDGKNENGSGRDATGARYNRVEFKREED